MRTLRKKTSLSKLQILFIVLAIISFVFSMASISALAVGMNIQYDNNGLEYTRYDDSRYAIDYYNNGEWFDMGGIANALWDGLFYCNRCISSFTGSAIKEAYNLDIIQDFSDKIGQSIQNIAGVTSSGISSNGLFGGFLFMLILFLGLYLAYVGFVKHSTSQAVSAGFNFIVVFVVGICFVANAPTIISTVAEFSSDVNNSVLSAASTVFTDSPSSADSTDIICNSLWNVQVKQPWLLLEFGTTDVSDERVEAILNCEPGSDERENAVKNDYDNYNNHMFAEVGQKFGTVLLVLVVNLVLSFYVLLMVGSLIVSQFMFLIYAAIMPFVFVFGMFPGMGSKVMKAAMKLFNLLLTKTAISLIMTLAFTLSSILMSITQNTGYLFVGFLQIVCFVGIYKNMGSILNYFGLDYGDVSHISSFLGNRAKRMPGQTRRKVAEVYRTGKAIKNFPGNVRKKRDEHRNKKADKAERKADKVERRADKAEQKEARFSSSASESESNSKFVSTGNSTLSVSNKDENRVQRRRKSNNQTSDVKSGGKSEDGYRTASDNNKNDGNNRLDERKLKQKEAAQGGSESNNRNAENKSANTDKKSYRPDIERRKQAQERTKQARERAKEAQERTKQAKERVKANRGQTDKQVVSSAAPQRDYSRDYNINDRFDMPAENKNGDRVNLNGQSVSRSDVSQSERFVSKREKYVNERKLKQQDKSVKTEQKNSVESKRSRRK